MPHIEHIIVLMMENHSYDNLLGTLPSTRANGTADGYTLSPAAVTTPSAPEACSAEVGGVVCGPLGEGVRGAAGDLLDDD